MRFFDFFDRLANAAFDVCAPANASVAMNQGGVPWWFRSVGQPSMPTEDRGYPSDWPFTRCSRSSLRARADACCTSLLGVPAESRVKAKQTAPAKVFGPARLDVLSHSD